MGPWSSIIAFALARLGSLSRLFRVSLQLVEPGDLIKVLNLKYSAGMESRLFARDCLLA